MSGYFGKLLSGGVAIGGVAAVLGGATVYAHVPFSTHEMYPASANFPDLHKHHNYMARVLTPEMYNRLRSKTTPHGWTIDQCIQKGVDEPGEDKPVLSLGCAVGDAESYEVFAEFFDKVIEKRHNGYKTTDTHKSDLDHTKLKNACCLDEDYVLSSRIRTGRNILGFNMPIACTRAERRLTEKAIVDALSNLAGEFRGRYYPLSKMSEEEQQKHIEDRFLFEKPASHMMARDWPDARGIWHNDAKTLLVWINRDDHAKIISMQKGGNMGQVFQKFSKGLKAVDEQISKKGCQYMKNENLGYIHTCPSNLGTGMRASVHLKVPHLCKHPKFEPFLNAYRLEKKKISGEYVEEGTVDISNTDRIGKTEVELVQNLVDGVATLIKMEKELENGGSIDQYLPKKVLNEVKTDGKKKLSSFF